MGRITQMATGINTSSSKLKISYIIYFDDVRQEVANEDGTIWVQNTVPANTPVFSTQRTLLAVEYGGEE